METIVVVAGNNTTRTIVLIVIAIVLAVAIGAGAWYWKTMRSENSTQTTEPPAGTSPEESDLGSKLYEDATNPVNNQLPQTVSPIPNPIQGIYTNPFE